MTGLQPWLSSGDLKIHTTTKWPLTFWPTLSIHPTKSLPRQFSQWHSNTCTIRLDIFRLPQVEVDSLLHITWRPPSSKCSVTGPPFNKAKWGRFVTCLQGNPGVFGLVWHGVGKMLQWCGNLSIIIAAFMKCRRHFPLQKPSEECLNDKY